MFRAMVSDQGVVQCGRAGKTLGPCYSGNQQTAQKGSHKLIITWCVERSFPMNCCLASAESCRVKVRRLLWCFDFRYPVC